MLGENPLEPDGRRPDSKVGVPVGFLIWKRGPSRWGLRKEMKKSWVGVRYPSFGTSEDSAFSFGICKRGSDIQSEGYRPTEEGSQKKGHFIIFKKKDFGGLTRPVV